MSDVAITLLILAGAIVFFVTVLVPLGITPLTVLSAFTSNTWTAIVMPPLFLIVVPLLSLLIPLAFPV